jgi:prepilin-type N-terminal cleavage/methylation domain-containing protein
MKSLLRPFVALVAILGFNRSTRRPSIAAGTRAGFTLIELMVVCAIMGIIALLVIPQLSDARNASKVATASKMQSDLTNTYLQWTSLGGTHTASDTNASDGAMALITQFSQPPSICTNSTVGSFTASDGSTEVTPSPSTIRTTLNGNVSVDSTANLVDYNGQFNIGFTPTDASHGTWAVTVR